MDTIANTISLPTPQTGTATMFDLKADDFATTSGGSQTLLVAAGQLPFVVADPQLSGSSAVLYPQSSAGIFNTNPVQPLLLTSPDGTTNSLLCYGSRVAVGTIPVTDASGNTVSKHIAVVTGLGGSGPSASTTSCPAPAGGAVLMVVDLSQAYSQGSPFAPKPVGFLQLPTSATDVILNGTVALVATGTNVLLINLQNPAQPTLAGQINGTFGNGIALSADGFLVGSVNNGSGKAVQTATFEPVVATQCPSPLLASLVSGTPTQNPVYKTVQSVTCTIRVVPSSTPAASATISWKQVDQTVLLGMSNVPLAGGIGSVLLPAGIKVAGSAALAQSTSVNTENNQPIKGLAQTVTLGTVNLVMDFNNDSVVDDATDLPLKSSKSVAFWASDAAGKFLQISDLADRENLLDYVTVRLEVAAPTAQYQIGLRVVGTGAGVGRWFIADKVGTGLDYLQISGTSKQQQSVVSSGCSTSTNQPNMLGGECTPITDMVSFPQMTVGTHEYLFRCDLCSSGNRTLQIVTKDSLGNVAVLDQANLDVRLISEWMSAFTARSQTSIPQAQLQLVPGWTDIKPEATSLNVIVHGYAVDQPNATGSFFPAYFKRMYWAGVPVLPAQKGSPQTVGIDWQGNGSAVNWPTDEFSALETGVPLAKFFGQQAALGRTMKVIAHSLGNMVVNSAISRLIVSGTGTQALGAITSFVMNEPAVPTEAFDAVLDPTDLSTLLVAHATDLDGFPFDQEWQTEWQNMQTPLFSANLTQWNDTLHSPTYITRPLPQYPLRWRQERPANGAPDKDSGTIPQRGPWVGLFASNPKHVNMTNTFSSNDTVLSVIWFAGELAEKPDILVGPDNMVSQYWAALTNTDGNQEKLWGDPACTVASACLHANIVRQWAELAYWFPSLSDAAGTHAINPVTSIDFTPYDPSLAKPATTHSYLKISPYSDVYPAWQLVKAALK